MQKPKAATSSSRRGTGAITPRSCGKARFDLDEAEIKPYLAARQHDRGGVLRGGRLFGLRFSGAPIFRSGTRTCASGTCAAPTARKVGLFFGDYFARPSKRSGAWMTIVARPGEARTATVRPLIVNVMNFAKAPTASRRCLSFDDARTLFHEFGHALHGLLSDVTYPMISGTSVATDFVELPSQLYEHWLEQPEVLRRFAKHYQTGEPIPTICCGG